MKAEKVWDMTSHLLFDVYDYVTITYMMILKTVKAVPEACTADILKLSTELESLM